MTERMNFAKVAPDVFKAMLALHGAARKGLPSDLVELVLIRASQINRCAYCLDMHTADAREAGETEKRIFMLTAFEESDLFSNQEKAALALTEAITRLDGGVVSDAVYDRAAAHFDESGLAQLVAVATTISAWNRINIATSKSPGTD